MNVRSRATGYDPTALSQRQAECLRLAGEGYTSKEIAREIGISPSTVDNHISTAVDRLGARNRVEAARFMLGDTSSDSFELGLITNATDRSRSIPSLFGALFKLPPLGGLRNAMSRKQRVFHIFQIAAFATAVCSGVILTIAGVVYVLT